MPVKDSRQLRIGALGCGPIAQAAHFDACTKARNATLFAICDVADDLQQRVAAIYATEKQFSDYNTMLADPDVQAAGGADCKRRRDGHGYGHALHWQP